MSFLTCVVNQAGSVLRAFINLLRTCLFTRVVIFFSYVFRVSVNVFAFESLPVNLNKII